MNDLLSQPTIPEPYLIYLGDVDDPGSCKTGFGLAYWADEKSLGQMRSSAKTVSLGLPDMNIEQALAAGVKSLIIGIAGVGGYLTTSWHNDLRQAAAAGLNIVSGAHDRLADITGLQEAANSSGVKLIEIRQPSNNYPVGTGLKRSGKRLLTIGTDCALGKKYTAMKIAKEMRESGLDAEYRATGQTGIMITGSGVPIDSIVGDFLSGAAEILSPDAADNHWDVIEGQGSLIHPGYAAVTLGLLHGSQPDEIVLCHDPKYSSNRDCPHIKIPPLIDVIELYLSQGRLTNANIRCSAISLNTSGMNDDQRETVLQQTRDETGLIVFDPLVTGTKDLVKLLVAEE